MNTFDVDGIYNLLPAWIRLRDQQDGNGALKALLGVIASQALILEDNLDQLYDDHFIETCQSWVIPYIGDLIGFRPLRPVGLGQPAATRAEVANTIGYRRRKGTLSLLEQLAFDVTGWPAIAVEYFERLSTSQYVRSHVRPQNTVLNARSPMTAITSGGPFDATVHSLDVRRLSSGRGRYNIPNVGVFVWRLAPYGGAAIAGKGATAATANLARSTALAIASNRYTFDPFGDDVPLVNPPQPSQLFELQGPANVPAPLRRYPLYRELETPPVKPEYFGDPPVLTVYDTDGTKVDRARIEICDLTNWTQPTKAGIRIAVDPELGRLVFAAPAPTAASVIRVSCAYAFSGDYGGGAYVRSPDPGEGSAALIITDFAGADLSGVKNEVVEISDSGILLGNVALSPDTGKLVIRSADFARPVIHGSLTITAVPGAMVILRGLGISGALTIEGTGPFALTLEHCALREKLSWPIAAGGTLTLDHSLSAALEVNADTDILVNDSVVDAGSDTAGAIEAPAGANCGALTAARSTIFGTVSARTIPLLENSIVTGTVSSLERQAGCVRYSYVPPSSVTPRHFRCQPDETIATALAAALAANPGLTQTQSDAIAAAIAVWLVPAFTSRRKGAPGYAQLADFAPDAIRFGAEDGDEMGVFFGLFGPRREANLNYRLSEYIRAGLEFGVIHAS